MSTATSRSRPSRADFDYFHQLRVRFAEIDYQGIVFNAHYLTYFDAAITEFQRARGACVREFQKTYALDFHLVKATVEYHRPIGVDALLDIGVRVGRIGNSSITWQPAIFYYGDDECRSTGEIVWVCARPGTHTSHPLPREYGDLLQGRR